MTQTYNQAELIPIEDLPYPMFVTTWWDRIGLRLARKKIKRREQMFLCVALMDCLLFKSTRMKVSSSLGTEGTLTLFFRYEHGLTNVLQHDDYQLRLCWIDKLLAYRGE